jgi:formylglycine-generating enzyme required for sulfatase activity
MNRTNSKSNGLLDVFISYSHKDEAIRKELENHMSVLIRDLWIIAHWHDGMIKAGKNWDQSIKDHLYSAHIILLLVSSDFLASNYCRSTEMEIAIKRHNANEAKVIPIIARPVVWKGALIAQLQALPKNGQAITTWTNHDEAYVNVVSGIMDSIDDLNLHPSSTEMILIPEGQFGMGTYVEDVDELVELAKEHYTDPDNTPKRDWFLKETPRNEVYVDAFYIDNHPVTNEQYNEFCEKTHYPKPIGLSEKIDGTWEFGFKPWEKDGFKEARKPVVSGQIGDVANLTNLVSARE